MGRGPDRCTRKTGWATRARRDDLGAFQRQGQQGRVALLHNSIYARGVLADELGGLAWARLTGQAGILQWLRLEQALSCAPPPATA